jgi:Bifunctional DNA primase/polymerase, N-terminal/Protein of unknown function (DUF3987)
MRRHVFTSLEEYQASLVEQAPVDDLDIVEVPYVPQAEPLDEEQRQELEEEREALSSLPSTFATSAEGAKFMASLGIPQTALNGKIPFQKEWQNKATTDPAEIDALYLQYKGNFGSVAKAEMGGFYILELDSLAAEQAFESKYGVGFSARLIIRSGPNRFHLYYKHDETSLAALSNIAQTSGDGFSLRLKNEQCVSPGSTHPVRKTQYSIYLNGTPEVATAQEIAWLCEQKIKSKSDVKKAQEINGERILIRQGAIYDAVISQSGKLWNSGFPPDSIPDLLVLWTNENCEGPIDEAKVRSYAKGSNWKQGQPGAEWVYCGIPVGSTPPPELLSFDEADDNDSSSYDMTAQEIAEQQEAEYPVYRLHEGPGPSFDEGVLYGPVGEVATKMAQYNESHIAAIYLNLLVSLGNLFGRHAYFNVNRTEHFLNEFLACVGDSSTARKGTGGDEVNDFLNKISAEWLRSRNVGGFGSPQGIIHQIRDDVTWKKLDIKKGTYDEIFKAGIADKRLCIREGELSNILKLMADPKTRADELLRNMWDGKELQNLVSGMTDQGENKSLRCTKPHGSIIGYTTSALMKNTMPVGADTSGAGNRFLYAYLKRLKLVPLGGPEINWVNETLDYKGEKISFIIYFYEMVREAQKDRLIPIAPSARKFWENTYLKMERNAWAGFVGRMTSRGAAHVRRLATIFALVDREDSVQIKHLEAALGIWEYSRQSARYIFMGYTTEQEKILRLAHEKGPEGITGGRDIHALFNRHKSGEWIQTQLVALKAGGWLSQEGDVYRFKKW